MCKNSSEKRVQTRYLDKRHISAKIYPQSVVLRIFQSS